MADSDNFHSRTPTFHHTDAAYILPNDSEEHTRLYDQHKALVDLVKNRIVHAPISSVRTILDVGCGPGIITRYLSTKYPDTKHIYGIDLSPVPSQPSDSISQNLSFIQGDFRKLAGTDPRLEFGAVDFLFSRLLICGMTDWSGYVRTAFDMLAPGGWAEMGDYVEDIYYVDNRSVPREDWEWLREIRKGGIRLNLDMDAGLNIRRYMEDAGFEDLQTWEYRVPFWRAAWKEHPEGMKMAEHLIEDKWGLYWHMLPKLLDKTKYGSAEVERLRMDAIKDLAEEEGKYQLFCVTIGRKPDRL